MAESTIIMTRTGNRLDPNLKKKAFAFLEKLAEDDSAPGLHIEPIKNSADKKVRTGRVDQGYRAVLFKLTEGGSNSYVFHGIWPHDDAIVVAGKVTLTLNPVNGVAEIRTVQKIDEPVVATDHADAPDGASIIPDESELETATVPAEAESTIASAVAESRPAAPVWTLPIASQDLVTELGFPVDVAERADGCSSEEALLDLAAELDNWQGQILLDLATGMSLEDAKAELEIEKVTEPVGDTDADILEGLRHPAAKIQFAQIEGRDELKQVIESGDFGAWRVFLHPQQRGVAERSFNGAARVTGGAGTGKTVVILHRARNLLTKQRQARVLLTTFTTNLANALSSDLDRLDPTLPRASGLGESGAYVTGVDSLASNVIKRAGGDIAEDVQAVLGQGRLDVTARTHSEQAWKAALDVGGSDLPDGLKSVAFLQSEYELVVLPARITTRDDYLLVRRPGRGVRLSRKQRASVWSVVQAYRLATRMAGTIDFGEAAAIAAHRLERMSAAGTGRLCDHVLVDEGQDLSPSHWRLLRALVAEGPNDIFIAEDGHQRIYGHRLVLSHYGIRTVGRSRRLTLNYRTTAETLAYAVSLLKGAEYRDLEDAADTTDNYRSARSGPRPTVRGFSTVTDELEFVAETLRTWLGQLESEGVTPETIGILVRDRYQRDRLVTALDDLGVAVRGVDREAIKPGEPVVMTMHRAKGTEFSKVILFGLGAKTSQSNLQAYEFSEADLEEAKARERSLLYVAASRARDELVVSASRAK